MAAYTFHQNALRGTSKNKNITLQQNKENNIISYAWLSTDINLLFKSPQCILVK